MKGAETESLGSKFDKLKWLVIFGLIAGGVFANAYFSTYSWPLRLTGWLVLLIVVLAIAAFTEKGKRFRVFAGEARLELRKVIWPSRQETVQTTLLVAVMVSVIAVFLWGVDSVLMWLVSLLTGQRGL